jgi:uncharacterized membrane protein YkvA (DUF1232 family)
MSGRYRVVPWRTLLLAGLVVLYGISPVDILPDYIPYIGVIDDIVLLGFFVRSLLKDKATFVEWEKRQVPPR